MHLAEEVHAPKRVLTSHARSVAQWAHDCHTDERRCLDTGATSDAILMSGGVLMRIRTRLFKGMSGNGPGYLDS